MFFLSLFIPSVGHFQISATTFFEICNNSQAIYLLLFIQLGRIGLTTSWTQEKLSTIEKVRNK